MRRSTRARRRGIGVLVDARRGGRRSCRVPSGAIASFRAHGIHAVDADMVILAVGNLPSTSLPGAFGARRTARIPRTLATRSALGSPERSRGHHPRNRALLRSTPRSRSSLPGHEGPVTVASSQRAPPGRCAARSRHHVLTHADAHQRPLRATDEGAVSAPLVATVLSLARRRSSRHARNFRLEWDREFPAWVPPDTSISRAEIPGRRARRSCVAIRRRSAEPGDGGRPVASPRRGRTSDSSMDRYRSRFARLLGAHPARRRAACSLSAHQCGSLRARGRASARFRARGDGFRLKDRRRRPRSPTSSSTRPGPRTFSRRERVARSSTHLLQKGDDRSPTSTEGRSASISRSQQVIGSDGSARPRRLLALGNPHVRDPHLFTRHARRQRRRGRSHRRSTSRELRRRMEKRAVMSTLLLIPPRLLGSISRAELAETRARALRSSSPTSVAPSTAGERRRTLRTSSRRFISTTTSARTTAPSSTPSACTRSARFTRVVARPVKTISSARRASGSSSAFRARRPANLFCSFATSS